MAMDINEIIRKTDWRQLQRQKRILTEVIGQEVEEVNLEDLNGLLSFLDHIQDCAVDVYGFPEEEVFDR